MSSFALAPLQPLVHEPIRRRPLVRPASAFLAQLALQYDGVAEARTARRERTQAATRSYGSAGTGARRTSRRNGFSTSV